MEKRATNSRIWWKKERDVLERNDLLPYYKYSVALTPESCFMYVVFWPVF